MPLRDALFFALVIVVIGVFAEPAQCPMQRDMQRGCAGATIFAHRPGS
jgi:hypothetical protein